MYVHKLFSVTSVILNKLNLPETQMYNFILARPKQYYRKQLSFHWIRKQYNITYLYTLVGCRKIQKSTLIKHKDTESNVPNRIHRE
jgi:hypothetical protein